LYPKYDTEAIRLSATFRSPAQLTIEFLQERVVFVFLFLSDLTALVAELTARNLLIFPPRSQALNQMCL
jgi:hypothetical protein